MRLNVWQSGVIASAMNLLNIVLLNIVIYCNMIWGTHWDCIGQASVLNVTTLQSPDTSTSIIMSRTSKPYEKLLR